MTIERIRKLEAIGFVWNPKAEANAEAYDDKFKQLVAFKETYGHCNVPQDYPTNQPLATWVNHQRTFYYRLQRASSRV